LCWQNHIRKKEDEAKCPKSDETLGKNKEVTDFNKQFNYDLLIQSEMSA
jgi:hypothetical protein